MKDLSTLIEDDEAPVETAMVKLEEADDDQQQADREDDDEEVEEVEEEEEEKGSYIEEVRESLVGPIDLGALRISMPARTDEAADSLMFFESLFKENYGEFRFRKALQIIEDFPGDIYHERNEPKLLLKLRDIFSSAEAAQSFLHECSSYLLMRQGAQGFSGKQIGLLAV